MRNKQNLLAKAKASLENPQPRKGWITLEREYELITPLFGGGPSPGEVDPVTPIRGTEIRGQLRFWWRATQGGRFNTLDELRSEEERIWGSASQTSEISVAVIRQQKGTSWSTVKINKKKGGQTVTETVGVGDPDSPYSYVAFPLRDTNNYLLKNVKFSLRLRFSAHVKQDLQAALWAWETFGGIGARTRRGFGALHCETCKVVAGDISLEEWFWEYECDKVEEQLKYYLKIFVADDPFSDELTFVTHLRNDNLKEWLKITDEKSDAYEVWKYLFGRLSTFRQSRPKGKYGRSNWPEPDAIRRITKKNHYPTEDDGRKYVYKNIDKFPRAAFGLPIIFKFKDDKEGDPEQTTLEGKEDKYSRLASPLILRPLACNDSYVGLALIMAAPDPEQIPGGLVLKAEKKILKTGLSAKLDKSELREVRKNHPLLKEKLDMLKAFLDTL